jgi:hypothetical protein
MGERERERAGERTSAQGYIDGCAGAGAQEGGREERRDRSCLVGSETRVLYPRSSSSRPSHTFQLNEIRFNFRAHPISTQGPRDPCACEISGSGQTREPLL